MDAYNYACNKKKKKEKENSENSGVPPSIATLSHPKATTTHALSPTLYPP